MPSYITLMTEDSPSEVLAERMLGEIDHASQFAPRLGKRGNGYIKNKLKSLNEAAAGLKIFVIVDRDFTANCPINLVDTWIGGPRNHGLVVRFAEMEIESWIMADGDRLADFLDVPLNRIPAQPDQLADPKQVLVNLARSSRSSRIREDMCPPPGATSIVGPAYNANLELFLKTRWRLSAAIRNSPSLLRAERRLKELVELDL